jgi:uncharacterized membrane protein
LNQWVLYVGNLIPVYTLTPEYLAWGVRLQRINLNRLAGVCLNGGACGLIRQSTPNLTNVLSLEENNLGVDFLTKLIGTAWLSSVRVVECYIYLHNGRNPQCKF